MLGSGLLLVNYIGSIVAAIYLPAVSCLLFKLLSQFIFATIQLYSAVRNSCLPRVDVIGLLAMQAFRGSLMIPTHTILAMCLVFQVCSFARKES